MSMISKSALHQLPENMCSIGNSVRLRVLTYTGEGQTISTTSVRLRFNGFWLKLLAIDAKLNNGSAYSFPIPEKWRACTGSSISSHSGRIFILLGSDNPLAFPKEEEFDDGGAVLWRSVLTNQALIHGAIDPEIITWTDPDPNLNINTVCVQSVSMQKIQEQLLLKISAENFSDPTTCDKLNLLTKETGDTGHHEKYPGRQGQQQGPGQLFVKGNP